MWLFFFIIIGMGQLMWLLSAMFNVLIMIYQSDFIYSNEAECDVENAVIVECSKWS